MIIDSGVVTGSLTSQGPVAVTGSVTATLGFTGSLLGTATTASYWSGSITNVATASYVLNAVSSSFATTASYVANASSFPFTGSAIISGSLTVTGSLNTTGTITAQTLIVQTITSSVEYSSGSNQFGSTTSNTHQFTGSVTVSGSLAVNGSPTILTNQTSSMSVATASYIVTAQTASYIVTAQTASYIVTAQTASYVLNAVSASYHSGSGLISNAVSSSYALSASYAPGGASFPYTGSAIISGSLSITGSLNVTSGITGSLSGTATTASYVLQSISSSFSTLAQTANTASYVVTAQTASYVLNAVSASRATSASRADLATTASYVLNAVSASYAPGGITGTLTSNYIPRATGTSTLGSSNITDNGTNTVQVSGRDTVIATDWSIGGSYPEALTVIGTYASMCLRNSTSNYKWLFHNDGTGVLRWYGGSGYTDTSWTNYMSLDTGGNLTIGGTFTEQSSKRYKENIETLTLGLDKVLQMRGVSYIKKDNKQKEIGVIAEEINEILPDVVNKNENGEVESVSYGRITAVLIEAIKEQQKQIDELKALLSK